MLPRDARSIVSSTPPKRESPPVKIQEADAKSLLLAQGLPVPAMGGRPDGGRGAGGGGALARRRCDARS